MPKFSFDCSQQELNKLHVFATANGCTKGSVMREAIHKLPVDGEPPKLTRAEVAYVIQCLYDGGWLDITAENLPNLTDILIDEFNLTGDQND